MLKFEDILPGDRIKVTWTRDGMESSRIAVADKLNTRGEYDTWLSNGYILVTEAMDERYDTVIELVPEGFPSSVDQRLRAWDRIVKHPILAPAYNSNLSFSDALMKRLDQLTERPLPIPTEPGTVFRATEMLGEKCDIKMFVRRSVVSDLMVFYVSATPIDGMSEFDASDISAWEEL